MDLVKVTINNDIDVRETDNSCSKRGAEHHLYALELISNESTKTSIIPLACTACGTLILHTVQV